MSNDSKFNITVVYKYDCMICETLIERLDSMSVSFNRVNVATELGHKIALESGCPYAPIILIERDRTPWMYLTRRYYTVESMIGFLSELLHLQC